MFADQPEASHARRELLDCIPQLRRYARGLLFDPEWADDLVQDTLERAWLKLPQWQPERGGLRAWAFSIMHNLFVDQLRSRRNRLEESRGDDLPEQPEAPRQTEGLAVRDLDRALQRLPLDQRTIILLVAVEGLSYEQAALTLAVPIGTVMSRLSRARDRFRRELEHPTEKPRRQRRSELLHVAHQVHRPSVPG